MQLRPSPDIFRRSIGLKSLRYTKYICAFQVLSRQKISREPLNKSTAALSGSFAPTYRFENLEILRSRWRLCRLTDAACPLRVMSALQGGNTYGTNSLAQCHQVCHCEEAAGRRGNLAVPCWISRKLRRKRNCLPEIAPQGHFLALRAQGATSAFGLLAMTIRGRLPF